jgi:acyl-CoA thioester hydrolase
MNMPPLENLPQTFSWPIRVYWEDTDAGGVVYYANYLKFLERARTEWLSDLGLEQDRMVAEHGVLFVVRRVAADYLRPARFNDRLTVISALDELGRASLQMRQEVRRDRCAPGERLESDLLLTAQIQVACVESDSFRPARIPTSVLQRISPR